MSLDRLITKIHEKQNPTVVGLDPLIDYVPAFLQQQMYQTYGETLKGAAEAVLAYNKAILDAICDIVPAVKPQAAYYELYGYEGVRVLKETIDYAHEKGLFVITDGKRNDIGSTMAAYANAHLGEVVIGGQTLVPFGSDALTVNGYLGTDGIAPLLDVCKQKDTGIFVLVKTSNPSSGELQDQMLGGQTLYEAMGHMCETWGEADPGKYGYSAVGAVVGATYPEQLKELRQKLPHTFFLIPGYGAQGGGAQGVAMGFDKQGKGAIVNSSRAVLCAYKKEEGCAPEDFAGAARRECLRMRQDIMQYIRTITL